MMHRSPILHLLLAILVAVSPSVCLCGPKAAATATSCCSSFPETDDTGCCESGGGADTPGVFDCSPRDNDDDAPDGGCERCGGDCKCASGPTLKAETPTTAHVDTPVAVSMVFGFELAKADLATLIRVAWIESKAVTRPVTSLLRQHCALTI